MRRRSHVLAALPLLVLATQIDASSHREAPFITEQPKVDGTDFYLFKSYEPGREGFVTLIANYQPLQDAYGGPNYFYMDPNALYEIHLDNNGDANEDLTFQFRFQNNLKGLTVPVGGQDVAVPLMNIGGINAGPDGKLALNIEERYSITLVRGDRRGGQRSTVSHADGDGTVFDKPVDNIGNKSIPNYPAYAQAFIHDIAIPGCNTEGRVFVGQRKEPFAVNLGEIFDLVNIAAPATALDPNAESLEQNIIDDKNITSLILEVPITCLTQANEPVIGGWTTASLRQGRLLNPKPANTKDLNADASAAREGGAWVQVSRLGSPLVNELVIGLPDKDRFNASEPKDDSQFATYVTNPTLPELLEILFGGDGVQAPNNFPRLDLVAAFLTGVTGLNQPVGVTASEMLRLNTTLPVTAKANQNRLGVVGGDRAGFPNGRRPGDDVVDIELRVAMGLLCTLDDVATFGCAPTDAPTGGLGYTDGAFLDASGFSDAFPYLSDPIPGSPAN